MEQHQNTHLEKSVVSPRKELIVKLEEKGIKVPSVRETTLIPPLKRDIARGFNLFNLPAEWGMKAYAQKEGIFEYYARVQIVPDKTKKGESRLRTYSFADDFDDNGRPKGRRGMIQPIFRQMLEKIRQDRVGYGRKYELYRWESEERDPLVIPGCRVYIEPLQARLDKTLTTLERPTGFGNLYDLQLTNGKNIRALEREWSLSGGVGINDPRDGYKVLVLPEKEFLSLKGKVDDLPEGTIVVAYPEFKDGEKLKVLHVKIGENSKRLIRPFNEYDKFLETSDYVDELRRDLFFALYKTETGYVSLMEADQLDITMRVAREVPPYLRKKKTKPEIKIQPSSTTWPDNKKGQPESREKIESDSKESSKGILQKIKDVLKGLRKSEGELSTEPEEMTEEEREKAMECVETYEEAGRKSKLPRLVKVLVPVLLAVVLKSSSDIQVQPISQPPSPPSAPPISEGHQGGGRLNSGSRVLSSSSNPGDEEIPGGLKGIGGDSDGSEEGDEIRQLKKERAKPDLFKGIVLNKGKDKIYPGWTLWDDARKLVATMKEKGLLNEGVSTNQATQIINLLVQASNPDEWWEGRRVASGTPVVYESNAEDFFNNALPHMVGEDRPIILPSAQLSHDLIEAFYFISNGDNSQLKTLVRQLLSGNITPQEFSRNLYGTRDERTGELLSDQLFGTVRQANQRHKRELYNPETGEVLRHVFDDPSQLVEEEK